MSEHDLALLFGSSVGAFWGVIIGWWARGRPKPTILSSESVREALHATIRDALVESLKQEPLRVNVNLPDVNVDWDLMIQVAHSRGYELTRRPLQ